MRGKINSQHAGHTRKLSRREFLRRAETFANMDDAARIANAAWEQILTLGKAPVELLKTASCEIEQAQQGFK